MKRSSLSVALVVIYVLVLSVKVYSSTDKPQTYASKSGYSALLFAQGASDSAKVDSLKLSKLKSPWIAFGIALVPGAIGHGLGHFYAGKNRTAGLLFGAEVAGGFLLYISSLSAFGGPPYQNETDLMALTGIILFAGSWVYDVIGSPIAVKKKNQKLLGKRSANPKFEFSDKNDCIGIVLARQF
jgi:hypothetical protein